MLKERHIKPKRPWLKWHLALVSTYKLDPCDSLFLSWECRNVAMYFCNFWSEWCIKWAEQVWLGNSCCSNHWSANHIHSSLHVLILNQSHTHIITCPYTRPITYTHHYMSSYSTNHIHTSLHVLILDQSHTHFTTCPSYSTNHIHTSLHVIILNQSHTHITTCPHTRPITYTHYYMSSYSTNHIHTSLAEFLSQSVRSSLLQLPLHHASMHQLFGSASRCWGFLVFLLFSRGYVLCILFNRLCIVVHVHARYLKQVHSTPNQNNDIAYSSKHWI